MLKEREQKVLEAGIEIGREEGLEAGRKEGREEGIALEREKFAKKDRGEIVNFYRNGVSIELIASSKNIDIEEVKAILIEEGEAI